MYTLLTIIISMMMITIHAEDCTKNVNWKTPSERNQLAQIQNVTLAMCRGEFGPNFDFALQAYKANPQNDAPLLKMICAKNSPGERRNLRALTNVCGQYFGVQFNLLESCPNKSTDPNFALASLILKCSANSDVAVTIMTMVRHQGARAHQTTQCSNNIEGDRASIRARRGHASG